VPRIVAITLPRYWSSIIDKTNRRSEAKLSPNYWTILENNEATPHWLRRAIRRHQCRWNWRHRVIDIENTEKRPQRVHSRRFINEWGTFLFHCTVDRLLALYVFTSESVLMLGSLESSWSVFLEGSFFDQLTVRFFPILAMSCMYKRFQRDLFRQNNGQQKNWT